MEVVSGVLWRVFVFYIPLRESSPRITSVRCYGGCSVYGGLHQFRGESFGDMGLSLSIADVA